MPAIQEQKEVLSHDNDEVELRENAADKEEHLKYDSDDEGMVAVGEVHFSGQKKALKNMTKVGVHKIGCAGEHLHGRQKEVDGHEIASDSIMTKGQRDS
jgi:hypothetical protein